MFVLIFLTYVCEHSSKMAIISSSFNRESSHPLKLYLLVYAIALMKPAVSASAIPGKNLDNDISGPLMELLSSRATETPAMSNLRAARSFSSVELIPDEYKFLIRFDPMSGNINASLARQLKLAIASQLKLQDNNVHILQIMPQGNAVEMYIGYTTADSIQKYNGIQVLIPASQVVSQLSLEDLQLSTPLIISSISVVGENQEEAVKRAVADAQLWNKFEKELWESWQLPFLIASSVLLLVLIGVIFLFVCFRHQQTVRKIHDEEQKHMCVFPVVKPSIQRTNPVQPDATAAYLCQANLETLKTEPIRIKAKGLLERRGSNASLTIDLNPSQESSVTCSSPSRERKKGHSSTFTHHPVEMPANEGNGEEFLLSAGNRMSRKDLRNSVKDTKALHSEFWDIPMNYPEKVEIAGSGTKNRYKTIIPNELSRVKLPENNNDPLSSYINANYIKGYEGEEKAYIAAQGPMAHTVDDFWAMVWQEKVPIIVMITKLKEKNKVKCEPYVPEVRALYGNVEVTTTRVIPRDGYTIRELLMKKGNEYHTLQHFWFTAWPDHKTPTTPKQLVEMAIEVESYRLDKNGKVKGPVVVHCSAGIGRTGCFIAISVGMRQLLGENMVDVLGIICSMRIDRGGMIQTAEQYEFVHKSLCLFEHSLPEVPGD